jgi:hypothetical protein
MDITCSILQRYMSLRMQANTLFIRRKSVIIKVRRSRRNVPWALVGPWREMRGRSPRELATVSPLKASGCGRYNSTLHRRHDDSGCVDLWMLRLGTPLPRNACAPHPSLARNATTKQISLTASPTTVHSHFRPIPFVPARGGDAEGQEQTYNGDIHWDRGEIGREKKTTMTTVMSGSRLEERQTVR